MKCKTEKFIQPTNPLDNTNFAINLKKNSLHLPSFCRSQ